MTREKLDELVSLKKKELSLPYQKGSAYYHFREFVSNYSCSKLTDFLNIDIMKFIQGLYFLKSDGKDINECKRTFREILPLFDDFNSILFSNFMQLNSGFKNDGELEKIVGYFEEKNFIKAKFMLKKIYPDNIDARKIVERVKKETIINREDSLLAFYKLLVKEYDLTIDLMGLFHAYILAKEITKGLNFEIECGVISSRHRDIERELNNRLNAVLHTNKIIHYFNMITSFVFDIENTEEKYNKNRVRELHGLDVAIELLDKALAKDEITNAREIAKTVKDEKIRYAFFSIIYEHNMEYYKKLESEYNTLSKNDKSQYLILLGEYNLDVDSYSDVINQIRYNNVDDVRIILDFISKIGFENQQIIDILKNTTLDTTLKVKEYIDNGIFLRDFIIKNSDLFYTGSSKFTLFLENVKLLRNYGLNPSLLKDSINVLFCDSEALDNNLEILTKYDLLNSIRTTTNYNFLGCRNLDEKIDKLLELGYENLLVENLDLLNYEDFRRLEVLKAMGMTDLANDDFEKILKGKFFISDDKLNSYIPSIVSYKEKVNLGCSADSIDAYLKTNRIYDFDGVLISSVKVMRLLNEGADLYDAMFSNLNLSEYEYNLVINCVKSKEFRKKFSEVDI